MKTINEIIAAVKSGEMTIERAAQVVDPYAVKYYSPASGEFDTYIALKKAHDRLHSKNSLSEQIIRPTDKLVKCDCGCEIPVRLKMSTSTGSSCPDCYDRMSV